MPSIADLFASLRLQVNKASFQAGDALIKNAKSQVGDLANSVKGSLIAVAGVAGVVSEVGKAVDFDESLGRLDIASKQSLGSMDAFEERLYNVSDANGVAKDALVAGTAQFISLTGNADAASKSLDTLAKVNVASGTSMDDISASAAAMNQSLGILPEDFEKAFSVAIRSGKEGAVELKDMAGLLSGLAPAASEFAGGSGIEGFARLSAGFQLVRRGSGTASQAATRYLALMTAIKAKASEFAKAGVKVFDVDANGVKRLRQLDAIVGDIAKSKLAKDPTALVKAFGTVEALSAFQQLAKTEGEWQAATQSALQADDVAQDYAIRVQQDSFKVQKALNKVRNVFSRVAKFILKGLVFVLDHFRLVALAIMSIVAAIVVMQIASIKAAIASGIAWLAATAPLILMAAIIAGLILIVEDLWVMFSGGKSAIGEALDALLGVGTTKQLVDGVTSAFETLTGVVQFFGSIGSAIFTAWDTAVEHTAQLIRELVELVEDVTDRISSAIDKVTGGIRSVVGGSSSSIARVAEQIAAERDAAIAASPPTVFDRSFSSGSVTSNVTVNVRDGADAREVATRTSNAVSGDMGRMLRDAWEGLGR